MSAPRRPARILRNVSGPQRQKRTAHLVSKAPPPPPISHQVAGPVTHPARRITRTLARGIALAVLALTITLFAFLTAFRIGAALRETRSAADLAPATGQFVDTGHGQMFLQDAGPRQAAPIVLIHGTAAWSEFWRGTIDHLVARGHRVIALDLPPFGFSDRADANGYSREKQAHRINGALAALKVDKAVLVGHSFGAGATMETVMRHSHRVSGLVLVAAALGLPEDGATPSAPPQALTAFLSMPVVPEVLVAATATNPLLTRHLLGTMVARKEAATPALADILRRPMTRRHTTRDFVAWAHAFVTPDVSARSMAPTAYGDVRVPTRIIWGVEDTLTPLSQGQRLSRLMPGATLTVLPRVGHIPQIEEPAAFYSALDDALVGLVPRPTR